LNLDAQSVDEQTLVRIRMAYTPSWLSGIASAGYLATLGRSKVGFSIEGIDAAGRPQLSRGAKAALEHNAMRYYLAIKAYLETSQLSSHERFDARLQRWFELTEAYPEQLNEMEKREYLQIKQREWDNQKQLQKEIH